MNGKTYILDTNIVIEYLRGNQKAVTFIEKNEKLIAIPAIVIGELLYGAYNSSEPNKHLTIINKFIQYFTILEINTVISNEYGRLKSILKSKGNPIPENDIWIAASTCLNENTILVSNDNHFAQLKEIEVLQIN
ncbi:MAG: PIN domain-containing protein [Flavobacteriales bacterium]|nr:PIN domain-containing protein [Flavobacteriales bacterium]